MDKTEYLKQQATEFVMALCSTKLNIREIAWEGVQAVLAAYEINGDFAAAQSGIQRLRDMVASK